MNKVMVKPMNVSNRSVDELAADYCAFARKQNKFAKA